MMTLTHSIIQIYVVILYNRYGWMKLPLNKSIHPHYCCTHDYQTHAEFAKIRTNSFSFIYHICKGR